jgi:hypothetical protein
VIGSQFISTRLRDDFFVRGSTEAMSAMSLPPYLTADAFFLAG